MTPVGAPAPVRPRTKAVQRRLVLATAVASPFVAMGVALGGTGESRLYGLGVHRVRPGLWRAERDQTNAWLLAWGGAVTLIDTGTGAFADGLLAAAWPLGPIRDIVLTHAHHDHAGSAFALAGITGARVWAHPSEARLLKAGRWRRAMTPTPGWVSRAMLAATGRDQVRPAFAPGDILDATGSIPVAGGLEVHHMPGHAAGHIVLDWRAQNGARVLFGGDMAMNVLGVREPLAYEDRATGLESLWRLSRIAKESDLLLPGHGEPLDHPALALSRLASRGQGGHA